MPESPGFKEFWRRLEPDFRRIFLLSSVLLLLVKISLTDQAILDPDLGWHLNSEPGVVSRRQGVPLGRESAGISCNYPFGGFACDVR